MPANDGTPRVWFSVLTSQSDGVLFERRSLDYDYESAAAIDGAFLTTPGCLRQMYKSGRGGAIIYMGSVHSKETSPLKAPYVTT